MLAIKLNLKNTNGFFNNLQIRLHRTRICPSIEMIPGWGLFHLMLCFNFLISFQGLYFLFQYFCLLFLLFIQASFIFLSWAYWIALFFNITYYIFFKWGLLVSVRFRLHYSRCDFLFLKNFLWGVVILKGCLDIFVNVWS